MDTFLMPPQLPAFTTKQHLVVIAEMSGDVARVEALSRFLQAGRLACRLERIVRAWREASRSGAGVDHVAALNGELQSAAAVVDVLLGTDPELWDAEDVSCPF